MRRIGLMLSVAAWIFSAWSIFPSAASAETVIRVVPRGDLNILDPIWSTVAVTRNYGYMVYDTLFALDSKQQPQPQMIGEYSATSDRLTYTLTLRDGLTWHDGAPVTAKDCVASITRWSKRNILGQKLAKVLGGLEAVNERTLKITLTQPFDVLSALATPSNSPAFMMPERIANTDANTQIKETIGSGPFIFKRDEWVSGSKEVFVKNKDYKPRAEPADFLSGGKVVKVDRVEWIHLPDAGTAVSALLAGEIDYYENPSIDDVQTFEANKEIKIFDLDPVGSQGTLRVNHLHPPFDNVKARQALLYAIKQEDYLRGMVGSPKYFRAFCGAMFGCDTPFETAIGSDALRTNDLAKAKQLLAESGYKGEPIVVMDPTNVPILHAAIAVTVQNLRKLGMNVDLQAMDVGTMISRRARRDPPGKGGWHIFYTQFQGMDISNPAGHAYISAGCASAPPGWPCDQTIEELRDEFLRESDYSKQKAIAEKLQARAYEVVPYIPVGQFRQPIAHRANLTGLTRTGATVFWNIEKR
jgi:peptide/nickel transport system substrate-binding protein